MKETDFIYSRSIRSCRKLTMLNFRNMQNKTERDAYQMSEFITVLHTFFTVIYPSNNEKLQDVLTSRNYKLHF